MNSLSDLPTLPGEAAAAPALPVLPGYDVLELVGRGGMGKVFRARHLGLGRVVAVKLLALDPDERTLARFADEARAVAKLQHPNIAQVFDTGSADGRPFFAMEFLDGGSLAQKFAGQPQDPKLAAEVVETVARAIQHSHDHGILHRDLKPGNILLAADGTPKVTDFGLAKEIASPTADTPAESGGGLTRTGEILGTPAYMPPEQASGVYTTIGPAADVYALGAILYEALTGRPPYQAPDALQTLFMVLSMDPVPPRTLQPKLPKDLETICLKCLEKSPRKRYATAAELADDLHRFRTEQPILARPVGFLERTGKWARRKKAAAALLAVSVLFVLALIGGAVWLAVAFTQLADAKREVDDANTDLAAKKKELEKTNADLLAAKAESDRSFALATDTLDRIVTQTTLKLEGIPKAEGVQLDTLAVASDLNRQLVAVRPTDREAVRRYARGLSQQLSFETNYHRRDAASRTRAALTAFLAAELPKSPKDSDLRAAEVRLSFNAVLAARADGVAKEIESSANRMVAVVEAYAADFPDRPDTRNFLVNKWWSVAAERGRTGDSAGQAVALEGAVAESRQFPTDPAGRQARGVFLVSSLMQLGSVRQARAEYDLAEAAFAEAARECEARADTEDGKVQLVTARIRQAGALVDRGKPRQALRLYSDIEPLARKLVTDFPLNPSYRLSLSECLYSLGNFEFQNDPDAGLKLIDEAIRILDELVIQAPNETAYRDIRDGYLRNRKALANPKKE